MVKEDLSGEIAGRFGPAVVSASEAGGEAVLVVRADRLQGLMEGLKSAPFLYRMLLDITCVDYTPAGNGFEMVYHLYSLERNTRLRVKAALSGNEPAVASLGRYRISEQSILRAFGPSPVLRGTMQSLRPTMSLRRRNFKFTVSSLSASSLNTSFTLNDAASRPT